MTQTVLLAGLSRSASLSGRPASPGDPWVQGRSPAPQRPASAGSRRSPSTVVPPQRPASAGRARTALGSAKDGKLRCTWERAPRWTASNFGVHMTDSGHCLNLSMPSVTDKGDFRSCAGQMRHTTLRRPLRVAGRKRGAPNCRTCAWEEWSGTLVRDETTCSVPAPLMRAMRRMWQEVGRGKAHFLCIIELCHNCEEHAMTTKHDPKTYQSYKSMVHQHISRDFPFIRTEQLRSNSEFTLGSQARRIGAFEVYLLAPASIGNGNSARSSVGQLLHSKLMTRRWPVWDALRARLQSVLPEIVSEIWNFDLSSQWTPEEVEPLVDEARQWGLESWDRVEALATRVDAARACLEAGNRAHARGDRDSLREAVQQSLDMQLAKPEIADWRDSLKAANMRVFNLKAQARRWHLNIDMSIAVRLLRACDVRPVKLTTLQKAVGKAKAAELAEEDYEKAAALLSQVTELLRRLEAAFQAGMLDDVATSLHEVSSMQIQDPIVEQVKSKISRIASGLRTASELKDLPELSSQLEGWSLPTEPSLPAWAPQALADIFAAERERRRLQALVNETEKRFAAGRWDALQSAVDRLSEVKVDDEAWTRWTTALQRERNFSVLKAVSGAGVELKRRLYASRLEIALRAKSIRIEQLELAASAAEQHRVDSLLVDRARAEVAAVRQRVAQAENAIAQKRVDVAEVMLWKLSKGRMCVDMVAMREGPLWDLADEVHVADAAGDLESMRKAIEGWVEDRPGAEHEAFTQEGSPTQAFRFAHKRMKELRLVELREQVSIALDALAENASAPQNELRAEVQHTVQLVKEMVELGWELTAPKRARLLSLLAVLRAGGKQGSAASAARFGAALLRLLGAPARVVFVLDQSKGATSATFCQCIKPAAAAVAQHMGSHAKGALWGAVAHGPVKKVQELTPDFDVFAGTIAKLPFGGGSAPTAKALRKALELLRADVPDQGDADRDAQRIVFNFAAGAPDSMKDATKAWKLLDAHGVAVIGMAIGPGLGEQPMRQFSTPGLAFGVESAAELQSFVEEAFAGIDRVLSTAETFSPEETLRELEDFCRS